MTSSATKQSRTLTLRWIAACAGISGHNSHRNQHHTRFFFSLAGAAPAAAADFASASPGVFTCEKQQRNDDNPSGQLANQPAKQPSLFDMMLNLGKMTRPEYNKTIAGQGGQAQGMAMVSPWAFLGSMGLPGGAGWGGGGGTPG